ncbi:hypothetical protein [Agromyces lapidis]|uniref:DNA-binding protein n=1 Tax=Agromyces lapidis TaxID=279574 RepID=A0ABV5SMB9_9MICO|nr:hypothetical protein [Agromyces lapidis]
MARIAYDLKGAAETSSLSVREIQYSIDEGSLIAHYGGRQNTKPLIHHEDLSEYIKRLPTTRRAG